MAKTLLTPESCPDSGNETRMSPIAHETCSGVYCRKCSYDLRAQTASHRCPECGCAFDPTNCKTFITRPSRGSVWRWTKRAAWTLLSMSFLLGMCWGWLYWGWKNERAAVVKLRADVDAVEPLGGAKLRRCLGSTGWVLDRATEVYFREPPTDDELIYLKDMGRLQTLWLCNARVTDVGLVHLQELRRLSELVLLDTPVADSGLVYVKKITGLQVLQLSGTQVTDAGLVHLKELENLKGLVLSGTQFTDAGLVHLKELKRLNTLCLSGTRCTDAGLVHLKELKSLKELRLFGSEFTDAGVVHLKEMTTLQSIELGSTRVSMAGWRELRSALLGTTVDWH